MRISPCVVRGLPVPLVDVSSSLASVGESSVTPKAPPSTTTRSFSRNPGAREDETFVRAGSRSRPAVLMDRIDVPAALQQRDHLAKTLIRLLHQVIAALDLEQTAQAFMQVIAILGGKEQTVGSWLGHVVDLRRQTLPGAIDGEVLSGDDLERISDVQRSR